MQCTYYYNLYLSESLKADEAKIKKRIRKRKILKDIYLIVFPQEQRNQLEIIQASELKQTFYDSFSFFVIGIADSVADATQFITELTELVYQEENPVGIREYLRIRQERYESYISQ